MAFKHHAIDYHDCGKSQEKLQRKVEPGEWDDRPNQKQNKREERKNVGAAAAAAAAVV